MNSYEYDLGKLGLVNEIDVGAALGGFADEMEFFNALTGFLDGSGAYLQEHDPYTVFDNDDALIYLINEINDVRGLLSSIGLLTAAEDLKYVENAVVKRDSIVLASELSVFYARMESIALQISSAQKAAPNAPPGNRDEETSSAADTSPAKEKPLVLAVDDKPALLTSVVKMLSEEFSVMAVANGNAALQLIQKHSPDLFLLDIEMPQMSGYELAIRIRQRDNFTKTPIIFLTSKGGRNDVITAVRHGGNDYIIKPVQKELLINKIWSHLK